MTKNLCLALCLFVSCDSDLFGRYRSDGCGSAGVVCAAGEMCDSSTGTPQCVAIGGDPLPLPEPVPAFTLTSVSPNKSLPGGGGTAIITGVGFVANPDVPVVVRVGGISATNVTVVSPTQISFTVPGDPRGGPTTSSSPLSVEVTLGSLGTQTLPNSFMYVMSRFEVRAKLAVTNTLSRLAVGDLNGDGTDDVAVVSFTGTESYISVFHAAPGTGNLPTSPSAAFQVPFSEVRGIATGDFLGDKAKELAVYTFATSGSLSFYTSTSPSLMLMGSRGVDSIDAPAMVTGRFSDPLNDDLLFMARNSPGDLRHYYRLAGGGMYVTPGYSNAQPGVYGSDVNATVGDINADGKPDFVMHSIGVIKKYQIFIRNQDKFDSVGPIGFTDIPILPPVLGDVNGDGRADLVYVSNDKLGLLPTKPAVPSFNTAQSIQTLSATGLGIQAMALAQINARTDKTIDIALAANTPVPQEVMLFRGGPQMSLLEKVKIPTPVGAISMMTAADINGDGFQDLVLGIADSGGSGVVVLINNAVE